MGQKAVLDYMLKEKERFLRKEESVRVITMYPARRGRY